MQQGKTPFWGDRRMGTSPSPSLRILTKRKRKKRMKRPKKPALKQTKESIPEACLPFCHGFPSLMYPPTAPSLCNRQKSKQVPGFSFSSFFPRMGKRKGILFTAHVTAKHLRLEPINHDQHAVPRAKAHAQVGAAPE